MGLPVAAASREREREKQEWGKEGEEEDRAGREGGRRGERETFARKNLQWNPIYDIREKQILSWEK